MTIAPIILFTFNRLEHTKRTVEALKQNSLASETELYIYSDGPRDENERKIVNEVRDYIKTIRGFKKITIIEQNKNKGLANSIIDGVNDIFNKYERVIVLEDDLVTSKYFLEYMNESLEVYNNRQDIWSIAGYSPNINIPNSYSEEVYLTKRGCSWGWATWKNRWILNDWNIDDYDKFIKNKKLKIKFNEVGNDMTLMLRDQMEGRINSWAIRWCYNQFKNNMWTVYPLKSYIDNIGNDLTGTHSAMSDKYKINLVNKKIHPNYNIEVNDKICKEFKRFNDLNFFGYIGIIFRKIGLYKWGRSIRNKIIILKKSKKRNG